MTRTARFALALALGFTLGAAQAQTVQITGNTLEGQRFALEALKGKVVMLFFWNTNCVPCVQKMPELRANAMGWKSKPFEMVLISTDKDRAAALAYLQTLRQIEKGGPQATALWSGDLKYGAGLSAPASVPLTLVVDAQGKVASRHQGRIAPEVWDDVAGLMP